MKFHTIVDSFIHHYFETQILLFTRLNKNKIKYPVNSGIEEGVFL